MAKIIRGFINRFNCARQVHAGASFCMYCGVALRKSSFFLYRLTSSDETLDVLIRGLNDHHVKQAYLPRYRRQDLVAQRVPDDAA